MILCIALFTRNRTKPYNIPQLQQKSRQPRYYIAFKFYYRLMPHAIEETKSMTGHFKEIFLISKRS